MISKLKYRHLSFFKSNSFATNTIVYCKTFKSIRKIFYYMIEFMLINNLHIQMINYLVYELFIIKDIVLIQIT